VECDVSITNSSLEFCPFAFHLVQKLITIREPVNPQGGMTEPLIAIFFDVYEMEKQKNAVNLGRIKVYVLHSSACWHFVFYYPKS